MSPSPPQSHGNSSARTVAAHIVLAVGLVVTVWYGWRALLFLTDDAFIAFRYVSNAMAGRGLVWNPEPFLPVEGYTSFLWVALLWGVWAAFGVEPPEAANVLSLLCGYATLFVGWRVLRRMAVPQLSASARIALAAVVLFSVATSRVFLTWLSSGLETSLFVLCMTWWVAQATTPRASRSRHHIALMALAAAMTALTRPDGMLVVAATFAIVVVEGGPRRRFLALWPLLLVATHLVWRRCFYGAWLPNTYYAKFVAVWPEAGWRYAASYAVENGTWAWLLLASAWIGWAVRRRVWWPPRRLWHNAGAVGAVVVVLAHAVYYMLVIGGDHFEYRVLAHLPLLLMLSAAWMAVAMLRRPGPLLAVVALVGAAQMPMSWWAWYHDDRPKAEAPTLLRPVLSAYAAWQAWLHERFVCLRWKEHKAMADGLQVEHGTREEGARIAWADRPVVASPTAGVISWMLPNVALIDGYGLNDWVVARTPPPPKGAGALILAMFDGLDVDSDGVLHPAELRSAAATVLAGDAAGNATPAAIDAYVHHLLAEHDKNHDGVIDREDVRRAAIDLDGRRMAHERQAPMEYVLGFRPNVQRARRGFFVESRAVPLTDADIVAHESAWRARVQRK